jgi:EAL domain-containing protein (putative c-di-GMP-specific phosphodiesterase class I)
MWSRTSRNASLDTTCLTGSASMPHTPEAACEALLLAPLDSCAGRSLQRLLDRDGLRHTSYGGCVVLDAEGRSCTVISDIVRELLPTALQRSVRGVFAAPPATDQDLAAAMLTSEPLTVLLDQAEVQWARTALSDGWIHSVFQPIVCANTGGVFAFEALVRAENPRTRETVGARQLMFACERLNLTHEMDRQARASAIRDGATALPQHALLFINFLHGSIYEPAICLGETVDEARKHAVPMARMVFELNDLDPRDTYDQLGPMLDYLRSQGASIALDNIGGGCSPLELIADLRPDYVKLERELVADAPIVPSARHTLDAVVGLARRLQMKVVAQGVETPDQMRVCTDAGVDYMQGFLFARPASPPEAVAPVALALHRVTT